MGEQSMAIRALSYTAYGHSCPPQSLLLGFNGEPKIRNSHAYALGNGHRFYTPILMRFCSPDAFSPFEKGGLNAYCYCEGDPINNTDPSGQGINGLKAEFKRLNIPELLRPGVKAYFKNKPSETVYHVAFEEVGYQIKKFSKGNYQATMIDGMGATLKEVDQLKSTIAGYEAQSQWLEQQMQALQNQVIALVEQKNLPKPLQPLPASSQPLPASSLTPPPRPPKARHLASDAASLRKPLNPP
ncbi:MAG: RHS repeat-associated core domain-containing protein [Pseudomonas kermanshahensis]|jgi:RHS repeat-associated protein|uniref:RHS repeat-associated core domain-containing protein n=1 Tax=Pseudomonas kermanshahensis TaxID=2745482 RepID=UPI0020938989|nr:RHS repeat-associated core domain-containing protein [Pseudomonas kermanshahensis]USS54579.1 hypothetical protein NG836_22710 [Pseudomonas kermanshahensis]